MARRRKNAKTHTDRAEATNQPGREPPAFENLALAVTPNYRNTSAKEDDYHYPGMRRTRFQDQDQLGQSREAVVNRWPPREPVSRDRPDQYRPAENREARLNQWQPRASDSRKHPDQYRPDESREAVSNGWQPRVSDSRGDPDQYKPGEVRADVSNKWRPRSSVSHERSTQYRPAEPRNPASSTWRTEPMDSRERTNHYKPGDSMKAGWDTWGPSLREPRPVIPDYGARAVSGDLQSPSLIPYYVPTPKHGGTNAATLPRPNRSGTFELRPLVQYGERERTSIRAQPSFKDANVTPLASRPGPTAPSYTPPWAFPLGVPTSSSNQSTNGFTPYQPLRSVPKPRKVPPRCIDKLYRFTHTATTRNASTEDEEQRILALEQWTASVTERPAPYFVGSNPVQMSGTAQQPPFNPPAPELPSYPRDSIPKPVPVPNPTAQYLERANRPPLKSATLRPLLLVIDLNGTLVFRKRRTSSFVERPNLAPFLTYLFANHTLMIWSSAQPENVRSVCHRLFSPTQRRQVLAEWGRDTLDLTPAQYREKVQVYKRLDKIWRNETIRNGHPDVHRGGVWDQSNTVLIDDSRAKAAAQPHNLLEIPEFTNTPEQRDADVLAQVVGYLEELRAQEDVSRFIRQRSFRVDDGRARPWPEEVRVESQQG